MTVGSIILLVVLGTSVWVAMDAPRYGLSWTWGLGCFALWIVAFPWYLVERSKRKPQPIAPVSPKAPAEGWYPDPFAPGSLERYWAGGQWTQLTRPKAPTGISGPPL